MKKVGGTSNDSGSSTTTDASGNVYVAGNYNGPAIIFGATALTNAGGQDMFLVKYDASGNVLWAKGSGGTGNDNVIVATIDVSGNVYVTGINNSPSITFGATTLTNAGGADMFIAKLGTTMGIEHNSFNDEVSVYPNPTTNHLTIALGSNKQKIQVTIADITGKIIYSTTASETQKIEVNTKDFVGGIYVVQIQSEENLMAEKLIVTK